MIDASLTLTPLVLTLLQRGYTVIGRTRTYFAQLNRERRRNEYAEKLTFSAEDDDAEKLASRAEVEDAVRLAFSAEVFLRYGSSLLKETRQALAMVSA